MFPKSALWIPRTREQVKRWGHECLVHIDGALDRGQSKFCRLLLIGTFGLPPWEPSVLLNHHFSPGVRTTPLMTGAAREYSQQMSQNRSCIPSSSSASCCPTYIYLHYPARAICQGFSEVSAVSKTGANPSSTDVASRTPIH